jgi:hypothetical protein
LRKLLANFQDPFCSFSCTSKSVGGFIDKVSFQAGPSEEYVQKAIAEICVDILEFARFQLNERQPRDDYREYLELCIIFNGEFPARGESFMAPGARHDARWIQKLCIWLKM